ncbi:MAG TPA: MFS transporter [Chloroflexia bacterium]|nr:MFS transporter [Chloroflexia bacterium]
MKMTWIRKRLDGYLLWDYPDLGVITFGVFVVWLGLTSVWPVFTLYMQERGSSLAEISATAASFMAASFLFQVPMGWASDRLGRKPLLLLGLAVHGTTSLLYLLAQGSGDFMILRFIDGIGGAAMMPAARAHLMDTVPAEVRGRAFGLLGAAFNGGMLLGPAIGGFMSGITGMTSPFWFGGATSVLAGIFLTILVHDRRGSQPAALEAEAATPEGAPVAGITRIPWRAIMPLFLSTVGWGFVGGFFSVVWNIWIHDLGGSLNIIGLSYTLFALPLVFVGPWAGRLADKRNRVWLILIPSLVAAAIYFSYGFISSIPVILALGVLEGAMIGVLAPASDSYMADVLPAPLRGRLQGMISSSNTAVGFIGALICGPLYAAGPIYLFLVLSGVHVVSAVAASMLMLPTERRLRGPKRAGAGAEPRASLAEPGAA